MTPDQVMLVKLLTDLIFTATTTLSRIGKMSDEEVKAEIPKAEATTAQLMGELRQH
jgi:hypothetical protein